MKFLVLFAVLAVAYVIWRNARIAGRAAPPPAARPPAAQPQEMVQCAVCSLHLPRGDALPGPGDAYYCCTEHRQRAGA